MSKYTTPLVRVVAVVACTGLVVASAGFGAVYAYTIGIQHGILLAGLTVLFAVALELIKPLAIHGAIGALASWRTWPRALALSVLGIVAVAYSLQAELALTASSRGDLTAKREQASDASVRAKESHQRAKRELASLKASRPIGELEALVESARPVCRVQVDGRGRQTVCSKPSHLVAELGRAKRKQELEEVLASADTALASGPAVRGVDPGSTAIATYLGTMGYVVQVETLGQWLILVPVLALELGSALGMVLVSAVSGTRREGPFPVEEPAVAILEPLPENHVNHPPQPAIKLLPDRSQATRDAVSRAILDHLKNHGGSISGSERALARITGTSKATVRRSALGLASAGVLTLEPSKQGTVISLV